MFTHIGSSVVVLVTVGFTRPATALLPSNLWSWYQVVQTALYFAVYVAHVVTGSISGFHPLWVYSYHSHSFVGVSHEYTGVSPYATSPLCNTVQS